MKIKYALTKQLKKCGIDTIFTLPAYYITDLLIAMKKRKMNVVEFASEFSAISAAYSYTTISNRIGVVVVNTGPSFTNILTGLKAAEKDNVPIVVIVGCQDSAFSDNESYFQAINISQYCDNCFTITLETVNMIKKYIQIAISNQTPVVIKIPYTLYDVEVSDTTFDAFQQEYISSVDIETMNNDVLELLSNLPQYSRPIFLIGKGISPSSKIPQRLDKYGIPYISSLFARNYLSKYQSYCGSVGILGDYMANEILRKADAVICLGCRLSERTILNDKTVVHNKDIYFINNGKYICRYDIQPERLFEYHHNAEAFMSSLLQNEIAYKFKWIFTILGDPITSKGDATTFNVTEAVRVISNASFNKPIYCIDDGTYTLPALKMNADNKVVFTGSMAVGGFSFGAAIGAYYADKESTPIIIIGDGGILSVLGEIHTIEKYNIPVLILIINNNGYESIRQWYRKEYNEFFAPIEFACIAQGFNIRYDFAKSVSELQKIVSEKTEINAPQIIEAAVTPQDLVCHFLNNKNF